MAITPQGAHTPAVLTGRVILITGASGGLGSAVALAAGRAGAITILCGRRVRPLEKLYDEILSDGGAEPAIYPIDFEGATPSDYEQLATSIETNFGRLDGILHAAAHFSGLASHTQTQTPVENWLKSMQVNLNAPYVLTQACLPLLSKSMDAAVVFVLEDQARVGKAYWGAYGVAKFALMGLVKQWSAELENTSVRITGIVPAPMRTKLRGRAYFAENPGLIGTPEAAAEQCVELLSPKGKHWHGRWLDMNCDG